MNILIVGGCGFLGSHFAEKLHKEGHKIFIIDTCKDASGCAFTFKPQILQCSAEENSCKTFFELYNFDTVIYSVNTAKISYQKKFSGLLNILELSHRHNIKKFIFISDAKSSMMMKCDNDYVFHCIQQETYCKNWTKTFKIPVIIIKLPNVYGPGMLHSDYPSIIPAVFDALSSGEKLTDENISAYHPQNYIYINDAAEVIKKVVAAEGLPPVLCAEDDFNISAEGLKHIISAVLTGNEPQKGKDDFTPVSPTADTEAAKKILDIKTKYSLFEGIKLTGTWYKDTIIKDKKTIKSSNLHSRFRTLRPYMENLILFAIVFFITVQLNIVNNFEAMSGLDYSQIYILIMGLIYGKKQSLIAAFLSMALFLFKINSKGLDVISVFYNIEYTMHLIAYLFMAVFTGYITDKHNFHLQDMLRELNKMDTRQKFLTKAYDAAIALKNKFYSQIVNSSDSIGWLYNSVNKLYNIESEKIYTSAVEVVSELMGTENTVVATINKSANGNIFLRRKIKRGSATAALPLSAKVADHEYLDKVVNKKETFVNKTLEKNIPDMAVPVIVRNEVIAVIGIYAIPFEFFSLHYEKMMRIISMMIAEALDKASQYERETHDQKYIKDTVIMREKPFLETEKILRQRGIDSYYKFRIDEVNGIVLKNGLKNIQKSADYLQKATRDEDYIGIAGESLYILMEELPTDMLATVQKRFLEKNIKLSPAGN
ncbi:NAD-dependent epimerase/dehydratase family protein [Pectinatus haikarae]|uniref:Nucleoside-diphosphate-sugar epimerase n=1 Tax=Pectinatus haikarae TaxID=349096 RepID=A0ABT9Y4Z5_9FIRM|nr:NAD-dependent epimerase/dehydratase family protein [Pectinatus haikarae]MDQ0202897.1 nucleoside-diphosphate-sugar epimerase [Pectinatus haikarae]